MVKRFELELFHCNGGEMSVSEEGGWVAYEDFAALQQERDALAAECAALDKAIGAVADAYETGVSDILANEIDIAVNLETPATDAFLNSVRAEGVDMAVDELKALAKRSTDEAPNAAEHSHADALYLMLLASQLRATAPKGDSNAE